MNHFLVIISHISISALKFFSFFSKTTQPNVKNNLLLSCHFLIVQFEFKFLSPGANRREDHSPPKSTTVYLPKTIVNLNKFKNAKKKKITYVKYFTQSRYV